MQKLMLVGLVMVAACPLTATQKTGMQLAARPTAVAATASPIQKSKVLSLMMEANAKDYYLLKKNLGIADEDLSRTDALELIVLAYAKMFDGLEARVANLELRTCQLENNVQILQTDTDKLQTQSKKFDEDIKNLSDWSCQVDDDLHNECRTDGVAYMIKKLRQDVASDLDQHASAIDDNERSVRGLKLRVDKQGRAIDDLINAVRSIR